MKDYFVKLWSRLSIIGVDRRNLLNGLETIFLNRFIVCQTILLVLCSIIKIIFFGWQTVVLINIYMLLSIFALVLNYYRKQKLAKVYQVLLMNVYIFFSVLQYGGKVDNEYFFLMVSLFGLFFFWRKKMLLFASITLSLILFFVSITYANHHGAWFSLSNEAIQDTSNIVNFISFILLWIIIFNMINVWDNFQKSIVHKNEVIKEKSDALKSGLRYAQQIQLALFPRIELVSEYFSDSFYYSRSKDELGGDFPFFYENKVDGSVWVAAADCTGHGYSGALISVLGIKLLHQALSEKMINSPEKVLDWLSDNLEKSLNTYSSERINDGMDISIAKITKDKDDYIVDWAGANNPLWIIPHTDAFLDCSRDAYNCMLHDGVKLVELRGNRRPVGRSDQSEPFVKQHIRLKKGDRLFMFSDGYTDQFGGEKNKKFSKKRFRYLLTSLQKESLSNFGDKLYQFITKWSKGVEQVDDILVIGIEL